MSEKQKQSSSLNDPEDWSWDGRYEEEMKEESVIYSRKQSDPAMRRAYRDDAGGTSPARSD